MKKFYIFTASIITCIIVILSISCVKELDNSLVEYVGTVVEKSTMKGIPNVRVIITNGDKIYLTDTTKDDGKFSLKNVNVDEIDEDYYILVDGSPIGLPSKKENLKGFGQKQFDYKTIPLYDKTTMELYPVVSKTTVSDITTTTAVCKATVTLATDGLQISDKGFIWGLSQDPILENSENGRLSLGEGPGELTGNLTDLNRNTTYYIRAYATNSVSTTYGEQTTFITTEGLPTISINEVTNIAATSATCGGSISSNGGFPVTDKGLVWSTTQFPTLDNNHISLGSGNSNFTGTMTDLAMSTTYYVRAYATNVNGTVYSAQKSFTTTDGLPVVKITSVTNVLASSATCSGSITSNGGYAITDKGFVWSTTQYPTLNNNHINLGAGNNAFTGTISNLSTTTTYYVRAYATNSTGTSYSEQMDFTTTNGLPVVTINDPSSVTATSAVCGGSISSNGGFSITEKGLVWSTSQSPTLEDNHIALGTGDAAFTGSITNLSLSTTYYVRAYATNSIGTSYSAQKSFTTTAGLPTVTTTTVTLNNGTAVSGGNVTSDGGFSVTARGICYGPFPNPDLTANYSHTSDGSGTGYYSSTFSLPAGSGTYYVRAYATNANGTAYGEQKTIINPYDNLPTFTYNGHTYRVAPDPGNQMTYSNATSYCNGLSLYGYTDWRLPTKEEALQMCANKTTIGGFSINSSTWKSCWTSTAGGNSNQWIINTSDCSTYTVTTSSSYNYTEYVRPIRLEN